MATCSPRLVRLLVFAALAAPASAQGTTWRASVDSAGAEVHGNSGGAALSADGRFVAFLSSASDLVANDTNASADVFVHDRVGGTTVRVSVDSAGAQADDDSYGPVAISADGRVVAFYSLATNLVANDTNALLDVFVHDLGTGVTERASVDSNGVEASFGASGGSLSADGRLVAFYSSSKNLVAGDNNGRTDVFVHDRTTGVTERVSVDSTGVEGDGNSSYATISGDGRCVAFQSLSANLVAGDANANYDVFVHDRVTGATDRVSVDSAGVEGNGGSYAKLGAISTDGNVVVFQSDATNLVAGDTNGRGDVFVRDRAAGTTTRASVDSAGAQADDASSNPSVSPDGGFVVFQSFATNLVAGDANGVVDVFIRDRAKGTTGRSSVDSSGIEANALCATAGASTDGTCVVFESWSSNLVDVDGNGMNDVFVHELCLIDASWSNYGAGFAGTHGIPSFTARSNPVIGKSITLDVSNSYGIATPSLLFVGVQRTQIHSSWGGDLLVVPLLTLVINLPPGGAALTGTVTDDGSLCGLAVDLQAVEADPGASHGVSFTPGLELLLGR